MLKTVTMSSTSKRYGRGSGTTIDNVFRKQTSSDPFVFDSEESDDSGHKRKSTTIQPAKKKTKSSSSRSTKLSAGSNVRRRRRLEDGKTKQRPNSTVQQKGKATEQSRSSSSRSKTISDASSRSNDQPVRRHITRTHSGGSNKESPSGYMPMQISSTTVHEAEEVGSDNENAEPVMSISTETVHVSLDNDNASITNGYTVSRLRDRSVSPQKSVSSVSTTTSTMRSYPATRSRRTTSTASSVDSQSSIDNLTLHREESDRLKLFLQSDALVANDSNAHSHESVEYSRSCGAKIERLKQFMEGVEDVSSPSVHSQGSTDNTSSQVAERDCLRAFIRSGRSRSKTPSICSQDSTEPTKPYRTRVDSLRTRLRSDDAKSSSSSVHSHDSTDNLQLQRSESERLKKFLSGDATTDTNCGRQQRNGSHNVESAHLKQFLQSDMERSLPANSDDVLSTTSSINSQDKTLVPAINNSGESKRLREFLGYEETNHSNSDRSSPASVPAVYERKESNRLKAFLLAAEDGINRDGENTRDPSPEPGTPQSTNKDEAAPAAPAAGHSGSSQVMLDINLTSTQKSTSPPKRRLVDESFEIDSDESVDRKKAVIQLSEDCQVSSPKASGGSQDGPKAEISSVKPVINFEKMEGRKAKAVSKPIRKLLKSPGQSPVKYRYNHRAWLDEQNEEEEEPLTGSLSNRNKPERLKRPLALKKVVKYPERLGDRISTQVKVRQDQKQLYTVVRNVRQAHECQDHGENQQIDDDLEFLLDGLEPRKPTSSRYLSAVSLAKRCTNPTFRMYLRSQGSLTQIFANLSDALSDPRLALSATAIMFMLCQDRLNMDLDRASLQLTVQLLEYDDKAHLDNKGEIADYSKSIDTVYDLYKSAIPAGEELLEKCDLSPGYLAMECLLVLTSRRSGDWFKEELREVGAIVSLSDSVIDNAVVVMVADYDMELSAHVLVLMKRICRGLRVLEHVTANNTGNQTLVIEHKGGDFVLSLCRLLSFGVEAIATHCVDPDSPPSSPGHLILQMMLGILRVLVNVTHDSSSGCHMASSFTGIIDVLLKCVLQSCQYVLEEQRFDLLVLGIGLSINMCEHSAECRQIMLDSETLSSYDSILEQESMTSVEALLLLFTQRIQAADKIEAETGQLQDSDITRAVTDDANESITEVLHKAGRHMEDTIVASYVALLIGVIVQHSPDYTDHIKSFLPAHSFSQIIDVLQKFLNFMKMADAASGNTGSKSIGTVISYLRECT